METRTCQCQELGVSSCFVYCSIFYKDFNICVSDINRIANLVFFEFIPCHVIRLF